MQRPVVRFGSSPAGVPCGTTNVCRWNLTWTFDLGLHTAPGGRLQPAAAGEKTPPESGEGRDFSEKLRFDDQRILGFAQGFGATDAG